MSWILNRKRSVALWTLALLLGIGQTAFAQRELKDIPDADPEVERKSFVVAEGMEVNLFAADPLLAKPIQTNFDAQGRLWVASSEVYPQIRPGQKATDKILVLEDTDGNGQADKTTVFADGLLIPTGVVPDNRGGAYVVNSTELIHLIDTDGDGKSDQREIVLSGFGTEDTHHLLHTLRWGNDGCLYMSQSIYIHSHVETPYGVKRLNGGGIWRFRPETLQLEVLGYGLVNSWGHHFDRYGQSFATDGAGGEGINFFFPGSVFLTAPGATRIMQGLNPGSPKHCGLEIVSGGQLPDDWQGNMITNDFRAHRVCRFVVTEDGSGFASRQETEVIKTNHVAFRPIDVKIGSDGALYIADWYNPIIQHGEVDFRDDRRDHTHGRIWRVTTKGKAPLVTKIPADSSTADLVKRLDSKEDWTRLNAKLLLKQKPAPEVTAEVLKWLESPLPEGVPNLSLRYLEAMWTFEACQIDHKFAPLGLTPAAVVLGDNDGRLRAAAVRSLSNEPLADLNAQLVALKAAVQDEHPRVRLEAVRALARLGQTDFGADALTAQQGAELAKLAGLALDKPVDKPLDFAIWQTMRDLAPLWLPELKAGRFDFGGNAGHLTFALNAVNSPEVVPALLKMVQDGKIAPERVETILALITKLGGASELGEVFEMLVVPSSKFSSDRKAALLDSLVETARLRKIRPAGNLGRVIQLLNPLDPNQAPEPRLQVAAARAAGAWKLEDARPQLTNWVFPGAKVTPAMQEAAVEALASLGGDASKQVLAKMAAAGRDLADRQLALGGLASMDVPLAAKLLVELLAESPAGLDPAGAAGALLARKEGTAALTTALADKRLKPDTAKLVLRTARSAAQPSPELIAGVQKAGGLDAAVWKPTPELIAQLVAEAKTTGNPQRGETIYRNAALQCQKCHAIGGAGGAVGPDMVSIGASAQPDYLVESILEPAKKVKEGYHSQTVVDDSGNVFTGIPIRETPTELVLRSADDKLVTIAKASIEQRKDGRSLMPDGMADTLTRAELVDLVRFLSELGKVDGNYAIGKTRLVRRWQTLVWTPEAHTLINRSSYDSAATDNANLTWESAYSRVAGDLPTDGLPQFVAHAGYDPHTFLRCQVEVSSAGKVTLALGKPNGLTLWVDGKPTPAASEVSLDLAAGKHTITLAVNRKQRVDPVRLELIDLPSEQKPAQLQIISGK